MRQVSPLASIERAVQERARRISLDLDRAEADHELRRLIEEEVSTWEAEHRRGLRPVALPEPAVLVDRAYRNLAGYGPLEPLLG